MLTTGFRSQLGIKIFGKDLRQIQNISIQIERTLADFPDTRSAFAERTTGGYFLDFTVDRQAAARYGLRVNDINDVIQTAIGGQTIATTVEGRERYPISIRYARDFRNDLDALKRVLIPLPALAETARVKVPGIELSDRFLKSPGRLHEFAAQTGEEGFQDVAPKLVINKFPGTPDGNQAGDFQLFHVMRKRWRRDLEAPAHRFAGQWLCGAADPLDDLVPTRISQRFRDLLHLIL